MNENEKEYLEHKIMRLTRKKGIEKYFKLSENEVDKLNKTPNKKFLSEYLREDGLSKIDEYYTKYYTEYYTKMEDSFKSKYRLFIFSLYLSNKEYKVSNISNKFCAFKITDKIIENFAAMYYQGVNWDNNQVKKCKNYIDKFCSIKEMKDDPSLEKVYKDLKSQYISSAMNEQFTLEAWKKMNEKDYCEYCGIKNEQIQQLREAKKITSKSGRGFNLEVDRKSPNFEYTKNNCCMSCYWCNNAKTDEFLPSDFKEIARGINIVWKKRLKEANIDEIICFPDNSSIWNDIENDCK